MRDDALATTLTDIDHCPGECPWRNSSVSQGYRHELALRLQHFSNAGIKHPNPGENFVQLRYAQGF